MRRQVGLLPSKTLEIPGRVGIYHPVVAKLNAAGHRAGRGLPDFFTGELVPGLGAGVFNAKKQVALSIDNGDFRP